MTKTITIGKLSLFSSLKCCQIKKIKKYIYFTCQSVTEGKIWYILKTFNYIFYECWKFSIVIFFYSVNAIFQFLTTSHSDKPQCSLSNSLEGHACYRQMKSLHTQGIDSRLEDNHLVLGINGLQLFHLTPFLVKGSVARLLWSPSAVSSLWWTKNDKRNIFWWNSANVLDWRHDMES